MATLTTFRQTAARELGTFQKGTAAGSGCSTTLLVDTKWPLSSSVIGTSSFKDMYLFRPAAANAADKVRLIDTYGPATGGIVPDLAWTAAPTSEAYEIHGIVEPLTELGGILNDALKHCFIIVEFSLAAVALQTRHSLTASAPWLSDPQWIRQVGYLASGESRDQVDPFAYRTVRGRGVSDGATVYLTHNNTFAATDTIYVRAMKRAYDHCAVTGGTYGTQSGLAVETDICPIDDEWLASAALIEAWRRVGHLLEPSANVRMIRDQQMAAQWFTFLTSKNLLIPPLTFTPQNRFGPTRMQWGPSR